jgi:hypothetical protein
MSVAPRTTLGVILLLGSRDSHDRKTFIVLANIKWTSVPPW